MEAKVPAPRRLERVPGLMHRTESTTCGEEESQHARIMSVKSKESLPLQKA
jgi:hypothetical protein